MTPLHIRDYIAGDTMLIDVAVKNRRGQVVTLVGSVATFAITWQQVNWVGDPLVVLASNGGSPKIVFTDAAKGLLRITIDPNLLSVGEYVSRLRLAMPSGEIQTVAGGQLICLPGPA